MIKRCYQNLKAVFGKFRPGCYVVYYHSVGNYNCDPQLLSVSTENFRNHLEFFRNECNVLSFEQFCLKFERNSFSPSDVLITFDDGYEDNLVSAGPLLREFGLPWVLFVTSGLISNDQLFYWDEIATILNEGSSAYPLEVEVALSVGTFSMQFRRGFECGSLDQWCVLQEADNEVQSNYKLLCSVAKNLSQSDRDLLLDALKKKISCSKFKPSKRKKFLTWEQLGTLVALHNVEIGGHSISHPSLSNLCHKQQTDEIVRGVECLQKKLNVDIKSFAYPYGGSADFNEVTQRILEVAKLKWAFSTEIGKATSKSNKLNIPRFVARNTPHIELKRRLMGF